jgi:hypothetical protein
MGVDAVVGAVHIGKYQVLGRAAQGGVGALRILGEDEDICAAVSPPVRRST